MTVRVVLADDHPMFRFGLRAALETVPELDVVGEAADGAALVRIVETLRPDVAITDLAMPGADGASAVAAITARFPEVAVIVLTMSAEDESILGVLRAGARGYLLKDAQRDEVARAIHTVAAGGTVYSGDVARRLLDRALRPAVSVPRAFPELTGREHEILARIAAGESNRQIAAALFLAEKTVRNNVAVILTKIHARDRAAAVAVARDHGLGTPAAASAAHPPLFAHSEPARPSGDAKVTDR